MPRRRPYAIFYAPVVRDHLRSIPRRHFALIRKQIEAHRGYEPDSEAANRKLLSPTSELEAEWELRFGPGNRFRVFYSVQRERREVYVVAIGIKRGNRLLIGREEVRL